MLPGGVRAEAMQQQEGGAHKQPGGQIDGGGLLKQVRPRHVDRRPHRHDADGVEHPTLCEQPPVDQHRRQRHPGDDVRHPDQRHRENGVLPLLEPPAEH